MRSLPTQELTALLKKQPRAELFMYHCHFSSLAQERLTTPVLSEHPTAKRRDIEVYILCYVFGTLIIQLVWICSVF